ncbi:DUF300-domain-containing protein [Clavulina sp. PMI_390]|nr:DUF300-domain-containing protein [Clavulina sp. PMI_390]
MLQRMTVRIMVMVPLYAIASLISLFSLNAAFAIDAIRDIYEAFVIYNFFSLIVAYLGGERSVLILLYGRPPKHHVFPVSLFVKELDGSDPFTFLFLKRGILQYVQVKPLLTAATLILKATGTYKEGELSWSAGYLYVSFVYNISICLSLYCLAMFWVCVNADIKPFRPMPKFLCVKGILFFSFWQALTISALVAVGAITRIGPYTDSEHISLAITDTLICYEMPFFAFAHWFAFSHTDYIDKELQYAARMPFYYAFRDAFGPLDVLEDSRATLAGGVDYRTFEPVEGGMHQGIGRERRIRAGLRYSKGGRKKYWLPMPAENPDLRQTGPISAFRSAVEERQRAQGAYAPILDVQEDHVFRDETQPSNDGDDPVDELEYHDALDDEWTKELEFEGPNPEIEALFVDSRKLLFGDYHYPVIDVSSEEARRRMWDEEEQILRDQRAAFSPSLSSSRPDGYLNFGSIDPSVPSGSSQRQRLMNGVLGYGAIGATSALRAQSDPDPRAARSALERHQKGKVAPGDSNGRKGVFGGWAESPPSSTSDSPHAPALGHAHSTSNVPVAEHPPSIPILDYTPSEPVSRDTDPTQGAIDLRYARTTTRPPVPSSSINRAAPGLKAESLGVDTNVRAPSPLSRSRHNSTTSSASRASPIASSKKISGDASNSSSSRSSPTITHVRPHLGTPAASSQRVSPTSNGKGKDRADEDLPPDAIDLVVEDVEAEEDEMTRERRKGEPAVRQTGERKIYRREYVIHEAGDETAVKADVQVEVDEEPGIPRRVAQSQAQTGAQQSSPDSSAQGDRAAEQGQPIMHEEKVTVRDESGRETAHWKVDHGVKLDDESDPAPSEETPSFQADSTDNSGPTHAASDPAWGSASDAVGDSTPQSSSEPGDLVVGDQVLEEEIVREATPPPHMRGLLSQIDPTSTPQSSNGRSSPLYRSPPPPRMSMDDGVNPPSPPIDAEDISSAPSSPDGMAAGVVRYFEDVTGNLTATVFRDALDHTSTANLKVSPLVPGLPEHKAVLEIRQDAKVACVDFSASVNSLGTISLPDANPRKIEQYLWPVRNKRG